MTKKKGSMTLWLNTLSDIGRQSFFFSLLNEIKVDVKETTPFFYFQSDFTHTRADIDL